MFNSDSDFIETVRKAFCSDGWLVSQGFSHRPEQEAYALDVAKWLLNKDRIVSLLDGSTGIGKTVAYLIPTMLYQVWKQQPVILSTFTLALQVQIIESDIPKALCYLESLSIPTPSIARRIGRRQFISADRLLKRQKELFPLGQPDEEWMIFSNWFNESLKSGYGIFEEWYDYYGHELPSSLKPIDLCILPGENDHEGVARMLSEVENAEFIITSHMSLLVEAWTGGKLFRTKVPIKKEGTKKSKSPKSENALPIVARDFAAIVMDEADKAIDATENFFNRKLQIRSIKKQIKNLKTKAKVKNETIDMLDGLASYFTKHDSRNHDAIILKSDKSAPHDAYILSVLPQLTKNLFKLSSNKFHLKDVDAAELQEVANYVEEFHQDLLSKGRQNAIRSIGFSEKNRVPSLMTTNLSASAIYNFFPKRGISMLYTSATLSDGRETNCSFKYFRAEMAIPSDYIGFQNVYAPSFYGKVTIKLPPKDMPRAFDKQGFYNPEWLQIVANRISLAASGNKNVLVLCPSYLEVSKLSELLPLTDRVIAHQAGQTTDDVIKQFKARGGILLSPALWEGASIRDNSGGQFFDQLVMTRIPTPPSSDAERYVFVHDFMSYTKPCDHKKAEDNYYARNLLKTIRKAMQGFGRLIRSSEDVGTVWFCDYKMPYEGSRGYTKIYKWIVPARFHKEYAEAFYDLEPISLDKAA